MLQNMTEGAPLKLIIPFMVPLLIGNVFQQLYNIADIIIVGRTIGVNALAAVGGNDTDPKPAAVTTPACAIIATITVISIISGCLTTVKEICY